MCGRYTLRTPAAQLADAFAINPSLNLQLSIRFNIAPTQEVPVVRQSNEGRELVMQRWGFFPAWEKEPQRARPLINARDDRLVKKQSFFKSSFQLRRCLIPSDGFFEWKRIDKKTKHPYYIRMPDHRPFAFAGMWTTWNEIETCTILTTSANELMKPLHDRMPVILESADCGDWLRGGDEGELLQMLQPLDEGVLICERVGDRVNSWRNDDAACIEPIE